MTRATKILNGKRVPAYVAAPPRKLAYREASPARTRFSLRALIFGETK